MDVIDLTRALVRYNTINPPGEEQACARHVGRILEGAGFVRDGGTMLWLGAPEAAGPSGTSRTSRTSGATG